MSHDINFKRQSLELFPWYFGSGFIEDFIVSNWQWALIYLLKKNWCWIGNKPFFNSLAPGRCGCYLKLVIFKLVSRINIMSISCKIVLRWTPLDLTDDKSTLVQVIAWCRQATSHYLSQCWPNLCRHMASLGPNELNQWSWQPLSHHKGNGFTKEHL